MSESRTTQDHVKIREWTEARGGKPATVSTTAEGSEAGILRIDFPGYGGEDTLEDISWDEFFRKFDEEHLAFLYQEKTADGKTSRFCKFVDGESHSNSESHTTQDHAKIREWAEARGGKPSTVSATAKGNAAGILRIDFPGYSGEETLEEISWDEFFRVFDEQHLAFLFQEMTADGSTSRFCKFVDGTTQ